MARPPAVPFVVTELGSYPALTGRASDWRGPPDRGYYLGDDTPMSTSLVQRRSARLPRHAALLSTMRSARGPEDRAKSRARP